MSAPRSTPRPVRVVIRRIGITAASSVEARRLADALPQALERALARLGDGVAAYPPSRPRAGERVAAQVAAAVAERLAQDGQDRMKGGGS